MCWFLFLYWCRPMMMPSHLRFKILRDIRVFYHQKIWQSGFLNFHLNFLSLFPRLIFWLESRNRQRELMWKRAAGNGLTMVSPYLKAALHLSRNLDTFKQTFALGVSFYPSSICFWSVDHLLCVVQSAVSFCKLQTSCSSRNSQIELFRTGSLDYPISASSSSSSFLK